jgi:two-component system phosphate regulon sensor histidine kinase PhoR
VKAGQTGPHCKKLFRDELLKRDINASFVLSPVKNERYYFTKAVNTNFRRPFKKEWVVAGFESPNAYFFKEMKWVIITSFLLIGVTVGCFTFTVKTLLSQHKLAELKNDFINNMTHELNTPLSSIKITAEALKSFEQSPETQMEYLDIISYQADKLTHLSAQILNANSMVKTTAAHITPVDLNQLIDKALADLRPQLDEQQATVYRSPVLPSLVVNADRPSLLSAFTNVIDNALKYTNKKPQINITMVAQHGFAEIAFADNGAGIPAEYRSRVFEQFFRVPQGNAHNVKGYGLGLSYVSEVVKLHKGLVCVTENHPGGSIITIKLPLSA